VAKMKKAWQRKKFLINQEGGIEGKGTGPINYSEKWFHSEGKRSPDFVQGVTYTGEGDKKIVARKKFGGKRFGVRSKEVSLWGRLSASRKKPEKGEDLRGEQGGSPQTTPAIP